MSTSRRFEVSVVIPCFNSIKFIAETIASVASQSARDIEIIVVDDGSTDGSLDLIRREFPSVRAIEKSNGGVSTARNRGIDMAVGNWIAFLDSDDVWEPEKISRQLEVLARSPNAGCCFTGAYVYGTHDEAIGIPKSALSGDFSLATMLFDLRAKSSMAMVKNGLPLRFPEWTCDCEDVIYFTEVASQVECVVVDEPLVGYRRHESNRTKSIAHAIGRFRTIDRWMNENPTAVSNVDASTIRERLMKELLVAMELCKWRRDWKGYWDVRAVLEKLQWAKARPAALNERIWPESFYKMKDVVDSVSSRFARRS